VPILVYGPPLKLKASTPLAHSMRRWNTSFKHVQQDELLKRLSAERRRKSAVLAAMISPRRNCSLKRRNNPEALEDLSTTTACSTKSQQVVLHDMLENDIHCGPTAAGRRGCCSCRLYVLSEINLMMDAPVAIDKVYEAIATPANGVMSFATGDFRSQGDPECSQPWQRLFAEMGRTVKTVDDLSAIQAQEWQRRCKVTSSWPTRGTIRRNEITKD